MAAVKLKEGKEFDCVSTCSVLANYLPVYARPRFIRIQVHHLTYIQYIPTDLASRRLPLQSQQIYQIYLSEFLGNHRNFQDEKGEAGGGRL